MARTGELSDLVKEYKKEASVATQECEDAKKGYDAHVRPQMATVFHELTHSPSLSWDWQWICGYSQSPHFQVNELCSTMQRYSAESEKIVQQREKTISTLKQQLEDIEKAKVQSYMLKS